MSQPRKHHYLPQFYLRGSAPDRKSLVQIEKPSGKSYGCQIKDVAAIRDYHELDAEGVEDPNGLEKRLAGVEGRQADHLKQALSNGIDDAELRRNLIQMLAVMRMRVPAVKAHIDKSYGSNIMVMARMAERKGMLPPLPPEYKDRLSLDKIDASVMNWNALRSCSRWQKARKRSMSREARE
jgi:hypothetical protein